MNKETETSNGFSEVNASENFRKTGYQLIDLLAGELQISNSPLSEQKAIEWKEPEDMLANWTKDFSADYPIEPIALFKEIVRHSINLNRRGNVGHQIYFEIWMLCIFACKKIRRPVSVEMAGNKHIAHLGIFHKITFVIGWIVVEFFFVKFAAIFAFVVFGNVY